MIDWKFSIGDYAIINYIAKKGLPGMVGQLVRVTELLTSGQYDYVVQDKSGEPNKVKECELDSIPDDLLHIVTNIKVGDKVKKKNTGEKGKVNQIDYQYLQVGVDYEDGSSGVLIMHEIEMEEGKDIVEVNEEIVVDNISQLKPESHKLHKAILDEIHTIYKKKNADYGNSFGDQFEEYGILSAVIRLDDKMRRLKQLMKQKAQVKDESIEDTVQDMANYCVMTMMELRKIK